MGTQQLHPSLRGNEHIVSLEQTDIRCLTRENFPEKIDIIVSDVSFVPLSEIIDSILSCGSENTKYILLVKPQFEVPLTERSRSGVVRDDKKITQIVENACQLLSSK